MGQDNHTGGQGPGTGRPGPDGPGSPGAAEGTPATAGSDVGTGQGRESDQASGTGQGAAPGYQQPDNRQPGWNPPPPPPGYQQPDNRQPGWNPPPPPPGYHQPDNRQPGWNPPAPPAGHPPAQPQPWGNGWGAAPFPGPGNGGWGQPGAPQGAAYVPPPRPGIIALRPLGLGEMLDGAFQACRRNPGATFGSAVIIMAVVSVFTWLLTRFGYDFNLLFSTQEPSDDEVLGLLAGYLGSSLLIGLITTAGIFLLQGLLVIVIARAALDRRTGFGQLWRVGGPRVGRLLLLLLLYFAATAAAMAVVGGITALSAAALGWGAVLVALGLSAVVGVLFIWLGTKFALAPAALVLENAGTLTALRRSWQLTNANWWRAFGILLLTSIIAGVITSVVATPVTFLAGLLAGAVAGDDPVAYLNLALPATLIATNLFAAVAYAFQSSVTALLYVDLRIRREGFDITLLREQEDTRSDPDAVPGAGAVAPAAPGPSAPANPWDQGQPPAGWS